MSANRFTDFQRQIKAMHADMVKKRRAIFTGTALDAHASMVVGHPITGAPGQPVDTGYLRNSFALYIDAPSFPTDGSGRDNPGTPGMPLPAPPPAPGVIHRLLTQDVPDVTVATNTTYAEVWEHRQPTRSTLGGTGSRRLTLAGMDRLVAHNFRKVYPTGGAQ
jgi:hypothetical protein